MVFYDVILMVGIGNLIASHFLHRFIQRTLPHLGAQRTWVGLFANVEKDIVNIGWNYPVRDIELTAQFNNGTQIEIFKTEINCNCAQFKLLRIESFQSMESIKKGETVFPS